MATADRVLSILGLFTVERPEWTVEAIAEQLGLSASSAYQYMKSLVSAGMLVIAKGSRYTVGPAIIELDRVTRSFDPLSRAARSTLEKLTAGAGADAIGLVCRIYRLRVMCVDQFAQRPTSFAISYERGRPMPLVKGAASKVILAHLPSRLLRRFYNEEAGAIEEAGLGADWEAFKHTIRALRKHRALATQGELDPGLMGISAPIFDAEGDILGSIGVVVVAQDFSDDEWRLRTMSAVAAAGASISTSLQT